MSLTVEAVYENGCLKLAEPLPFPEHERLQVTVCKKTSVVQQTYGILGWTGDAETFDRLLAEAELDAEEGT
jgi:predicted DNA-binding antitoxin AbrB/MazE fold protein